MNKITFSLLAVLWASACSDNDIKITRQGSFAVGGTTVQRAGIYDNSKFVGWTEQSALENCAKV